MAEQWVDPWERSLGGPWTKRMEQGQQPCPHCGKPAAMTEPGTRTKAHKVCAQGNPSAGPLGTFTEDRDSKLEPKVLGCGIPPPWQMGGRVCAGLGTTPSCRLCPSSPTYWRGNE